MSGQDMVALPLRDRVRQECRGKLEEAENGGGVCWRQFHCEEPDVLSPLVWRHHFSKEYSVKTLLRDHCLLASFTRLVNASGPPGEGPNIRQ
jgi:hypothetical protein